MNYSFRQLSAFIAVANIGSFTSAARAMHLTQSAVSLLIKDLESTTGLKLFDRTSRSVRLSSVGESFLPFAMKIIEDYHQADQYVKDLRELRSAVVSISAAPLIACTVLPRIIAAFSKDFPGIRVTPIDVPMASVQQNVARGDSDLGLGPQRELDNDIESQHLFSTPVSIVCRPDHPFYGRNITWNELKREQLIVVGRESIDYIAMNIGNVPPFEVGLVVNHMATALGMAAVGAGVVLAGPFVSTIANSYGLVLASLGEPVLNRQFEIYTRANRSLTPAASIFVEFMHRFVKENDPNEPWQVFPGQ